MTRSLRISFIALLMVCALPLFAHAQATDLQSTIRAALAGDPRTQGMTQAQIDAMVSLLSQEVKQTGLTSEDITWRPVPPSAPSSAASCGTFPAFFCTVSAAFGFTGDDYIIPLWLGISALLLIFIFGALLEYRHFRHLHPRVMPPSTLQ